MGFPARNRFELRPKWNLGRPPKPKLYGRLRRPLQLRLVVRYTRFWRWLDALWRRRRLDALRERSMDVHGRYRMGLGEQRALGLAALSFWRVGQCSRTRLGLGARWPRDLA